MTRVRGQRRPPRRDRIEVWRIILWSGLTNLVLLSIFLAAQHFDLKIFRTANPKGPTEASRLIISPANGTSIVGRIPPKDDFSTSTMVVAKNEPETETETVDEATTEETTADLALAAGASMDDSEALRATPILRKSPQGGKLEIGSFKSLSLVGSPEDCLSFADALIRDAGVRGEKPNVVTAVAEITIARICAINGSVIITCRGGQVAVSPRKSRPDDQCERKG